MTMLSLRFFWIESFQFIDTSLKTVLMKSNKITISFFIFFKHFLSCPYSHVGKKKHSNLVYVIRGKLRTIVLPVLFYVGSSGL